MATRRSGGRRRYGMASRLRQVMRELRAEVASHSDVWVDPPHVYVWLYW